MDMTNASRSDESSTSALRSIAQGMRVIDPDRNYYAVTLSVNPNGAIIWTTHLTEWTGWANLERRIELRGPSLVEPTYMSNLWDSLGQRWVAVHDEQQFVIYTYRGGNGLLEAELVKTHFPEFLKPKEVYPSGPLGFNDIQMLAPEARRRSPSAKQRFRVLKRDARRCRFCGRGPDFSTDIQLHLHHIRPWAAGGATEDENLITLCHTCHLGVYPHFDPDLFEILDPEPATILSLARAYRNSVQKYRTTVRNLTL